MARRGYRLFRCDDCKEKSWHHWIERNRAARMRRPRCGCARLELVTEEAKDELAKAAQVRVDGHRDMTRPPGELDSHKKVT